MIIKQVEISGFGQWSQKKIDFVTDFQVISGQNESGKSTLRAFIVGILFGFPSKKSNTNVYDPKDGSQYGGSLIADFDNTLVKITRLGRTKSELTITYLSNQLNVVNPEKWLTNQLAPLNRDVFNSIFNFSQQDLSKISQLKGIDLQKLLLNIGAIGSSGWLEIAADLEKHADKQFAQRATGKRPLNIAAKQYEEHNELLLAKNEEMAAYVSENENIAIQTQILSQNYDEVRQLTHRVQTSQNVIQKYKLYQSAQLLQTKVTASVSAVTDTDVASLQRLKIGIDTHQHKINELNKLIEKTPQTKDFIEQYDATSELVKIQVAERHLQEQINQRNDMMANEKRLGQRFLSKKIPELLTSSEQKALSNKNKSIIMILIGLLFGIVSFFTVKAFVVVALLIIVYGYYLFQTRRKLLHKIQKRYNMMSFSDIELLQSNIKQLSDLQHQLVAIDTDILDKKNKIRAQLLPIADHFQVQLSDDEYEAVIIELFHINDQQHIKAENNVVMLAQTNQRVLAEIKHHQEQLVQQLSDQQNILQKYHVINEQELLVLKQNYVDQSRNKQRYDDMMQQIEPETIIKLQKLNDEKELSEQLILLQNKLEQTQRIGLNLQAQLSDMQAKQKQRISHDQFLSLQQNLADEQTSLIEQFGDYITEKMVVEWIDQALQLATQNRFPKMQHIATDYFKRLTGGKYVAIQFDKNDLNLISLSGQKYGVIELSTGTQEQLYVALRLALSRVIADIVTVPLLIDDGFVNFDSTRKQTMIDILQETAKQQQIFYFTTSFSHMTKINVINL
ncbi:ATP-binding protein [Leuconostoc inhae]|uniref:ATP-binding protein n=1 Tax=Leuconostoc inhae TaxID=178001 RepID=UPI001C7DA7EB|nr:AAA family ATPase [Leuconostoc inhae]